MGENEAIFKRGDVIFIANDQGHEIEWWVSDPDDDGRVRLLNPETDFTHRWYTQEELAEKVIRKA